MLLHVLLAARANAGDEDLATFDWHAADGAHVLRQAGIRRVSSLALWGMFLFGAGFWWALSIANANSCTIGLRHATVRQHAACAEDTA